MPIERRAFLKVAGLIGATAACSSILTSCDGPSLPPRQDILGLPERLPPPLWNMPTNHTFLIDGSSLYINNKQRKPSVVDIATGRVEWTGIQNTQIVHADQNTLFLNDVFNEKSRDDKKQLTDNTFYGPIRSITAIDRKTKELLWTSSLHPTKATDKNIWGLLLFRSDHIFVNLHVSSYVTAPTVHFFEENTFISLIGMRNGNVLKDDYLSLHEPILYSKNERWLPYRNNHPYERGTGAFINTDTLEIVNTDATPICAKGDIAFVKRGVTIEAVDLTTQKILWSVKTGSLIDFGIDLNFYNNIALVSWDEPNSKKCVQAIEYSSGKKLWESKDYYVFSQNENASGIYLGDYVRDQIYRIKKVDSQSGNKLWEQTVSTDGLSRGLDTSDPAVAFLFTDKGIVAIDGESGKILGAASIDISYKDPYMSIPEESKNIISVGSYLLAFDKVQKQFTLLARFDTNGETITKIKRSNQYLLVETAQTTKYPYVPAEKNLYCYKLE